MCELRHRALRSWRWLSTYWLVWEGLSVKRRGAQDGSSAAGLSLGDGLYRTPVRPEVSLAARNRLWQANGFVRYTWRSFSPVGEQDEASLRSCLGGRY